jgi:ribosomal protein S18 acetylase RimI-like enzyme
MPTLRPATADDAQIIAEYTVAMALETEHKRLDPETVLAGVRHGIANPAEARYFVAETNGQVVGQLMVTFEWSDWRNGTFWWIQSVYVHPDHRTAGVFKSLYRHVELLARQQNACGLRLYVERDNRRAQDVYRRLGMADSGYAVYEVDWSL